MQVQAIQDFVAPPQAGPPKKQGEGKPGTFESIFGEGMKEIAKTPEKQPKQMPEGDDAILAALIQMPMQPISLDASAEEQPENTIQADSIVIDLQGQPRVIEPNVSPPTEEIAQDSGIAQQVTARMPEEDRQGMTSDIACPLEIENEEPINTELMPTDALEESLPVTAKQEPPVELPEEISEAAEKAAPEKGAALPPEKSVHAPENKSEPQFQNPPGDMQTIIAEGVVTGENAMKADTVYATKETLLDTMIEQIKTGKTEKGDSIEIQLKPEFLGRVSIRLVLEGGELQAKIRSEDASVRSMLNEQLSSLRDTLSEKGISVAEIEVTHAFEGGMNFKDGDGQHEAGQQKHSYGEAIGNAPDSPSFMMHEPQLDLQLEEEPQRLEVSA